MGPSYPLIFLRHLYAIHPIKSEYIQFFNSVWLNPPISALTLKSTFSVVKFNFWLLNPYSTFLVVKFNFLVVKSLLSACCSNLICLLLLADSFVQNLLLINSNLSFWGVVICFVCSFEWSFLDDQVHQIKSFILVHVFMSHFHSIGLSEHEVSQIHWWIITFPLRLLLGYTAPIKIDVERCAWFPAWNMFYIQCGFSTLAH